MKTLHFTVEQIIQILTEAKLPGKSIIEICRTYGISRATYDNRRKKCAGISAEEAKRPQALESENSMLKRLPAEKVIELAIAKNIIKKLNTKEEIREY